MKFNPVLILSLILVAVVAWNVRGCFTKVQKPEQMIRNEERLKYLEAERVKDSVAYVSRIAFYDSALTASDQRYTELENKKPYYNAAIKNTPAIIRNYDREQLSSEFSNGK